MISRKFGIKSKRQAERNSQPTASSVKMITCARGADKKKARKRTRIKVPTSMNEFERQKAGISEEERCRQPSKAKRRDRLFMGDAAFSL